MGRSLSARQQHLAAKKAEAGVAQRDRESRDEWKREAAAYLTVAHYGYPQQPPARKDHGYYQGFADALHGWGRVLHDQGQWPEYLALANHGSLNDAGLRALEVLAIAAKGDVKRAAKRLADLEIDGRGASDFSAQVGEWLRHDLRTLYQGGAVSRLNGSPAMEYVASEVMPMAPLATEANATPIVVVVQGAASNSDGATRTEAYSGPVRPAIDGAPHKRNGGPGGAAELEFGPGCYYLWGKRHELRGRPLEYLSRIWSGRDHRLAATNLRDADDYSPTESTHKSQVSVARTALEAAIRERLPDYVDNPIPCKGNGKDLAWAIELPARPE